MKPSRGSDPFSTGCFDCPGSLAAAGLPAKAPTPSTRGPRARGMGSIRPDVDSPVADTRRPELQAGVRRTKAARAGIRGVEGQVDVQPAERINGLVVVADAL